jgi:hypothetical protein
MSADDAARRAFALPPLPPDATLGEDIVLAWLDPEDEDERRMLIRAAHPEMHEALEAGEDEIVLNGQTVNVRMHLAVHDMVAAQLWSDDPPEVWQTAQRLSGAGFDQHEVLHMLGSAMTPQLLRALHDQRPDDHEEHVAALAALPGDWAPPNLQGHSSHKSTRQARARARKAQRAARRRNRR